MLVQISEARFKAAYRLGRQLTQEGIRSYEARDTSEHVVMIHFIGRVDSPETQNLLAQLATLPPGHKTGLEAAFQVGEQAILVTRFMPHVKRFDDWYLSVAGEKTLSDGTAPGVRPDIPYDGPTLLTGELEGGVRPTGEAAGPAHGAPVTEPSAPKDEAGDFTRMFGPVKAGAEGPVSGEPQEEVVASFGDSPTAEEPRGGAAKDTPPKPPAKEQGEFTRMFGALADEPAEPPKEPAASPPAGPPPAEPSAAAPSPDKIDGGFTEMFGPTDRPPADPRQSQTLVEQPGTPSPPIRGEQPPEVKRPADARPGKPRIVWRDRAKEEAPPQPADMRKQPPPTARPGAGQSPPSAAPPPSPPEKAPGQFTEIFGQALSAETESAGSEPPARDDFNIPLETELPPQYTGPRKSVSEQVAPLPERPSSDYLRALSGEPPVEPPRPAPAHEPPPRQQDQALPDLPPPIASAPPPAPGPSDYTRVVAGGTVQPREAPPPPPPAPTPAAPPAPAAQEPAEPQTPTWLWVALAAIGIVAVLLVVLVLLT